MKRRDFNRIVLGAGVSPIFAKSSFAQMSPEELQRTPAKAAAPSIVIKNSPRTYNQVNVPRKYTAGRRRFTIYWTWSYPWESNRDVAELDNRFSTMTEVRRVGWPRYENLNGRSGSSCKESLERWNYFICRPCGFRTLSVRSQDSRSSSISGLTKRVNACR